MAPKKRSSPLSKQPASTSTSTSSQHINHTPSDLSALQHSTSTHELGLATRPRNTTQPPTSSFIDPTLRATPIDPSLQPRIPIAGSPVPSSEGTAPGSNSHRQSSSSTMRTPTLSLEGTPTSTPTGRISKAKKGKRVHACSFEGCGKVRHCTSHFHNSSKTDAC
jgi:hypothetical protein